jgi:PAS domain S-box-containing protein
MRILAILLGVGWLGSFSLDGQPLPELHAAADVRRLTAEQAALGYPVRLRGVVTFFNQSLFSRFVQDETAGIYLGDYPNLVTLPPGQLVEIVGKTSAGEYAPVIAPQTVTVAGTGELPAPKPVTFEQLASGQEDSQFVEVHGVVRSVHLDEASQFLLIDVAAGGGRLTAYVTNLPPAQTPNLVDTTVRICGVCSSQFNRQRQLFYLRLMVPRPTDFVIEKPAAEQPFAIPTQTIGSLLQFSAQGTYGHRVKVVGTVIYQQPGGSLFLEEDNQGLLVQTQQRTPLRPGDRVEALGFPARGEYTPTLQDAVYRKVRSGFEPEPVSVTVDEALKGTGDCQLVRIEANLVDRARYSREQFLVLEERNFVFHAYHEQEEGSASFGRLDNGSRVAVTGVCLIEPGADWRAGEAWRAKSFRILLRSPKDVQLLRAPSWWTPARILWMTGVLGVVVLGAFAWVGVLRRRVQQQTEIIRQKLGVEAALKERYVELFENANDVVYTHDLSGRLTSVNRTGERVLQRSRESLLSRYIVELVVPEQQAAAQQWLEQVVKNTAPVTVEWDFAAASGQPVKLEIGTRLIEQNGKQVEVEGIARDVTERKRLERELLDISNREQRRIGHDLHDGICQQLVGISYLTETLADRLQEKGIGEASEAERIGGLLNNALTQTRGVARGLFPVRLEENGLVSALEELATNATNLFQVPCSFTSDKPPERIDNTAALHLYYIAQEAVANAAKHGHAKNVQLTLEPLHEHYVLTVRDDGQGFSADSTRPSGMGLRIMDYRARVIGATLEVQSRPGQGTAVKCTFMPASRENNGANGGS